jgi:hypothetical protein
LGGIGGVLMDCTCSISAGVDDFCEMVSERWVTSRSIHFCYECGYKIHPGERYYREVTKDEDGIHKVKTCADCISIRDNLVGDFFYGQMRDMLSDAIYDCDGKIPEKCIAKLTPKARAWICGEIEKCWDKMKLKNFSIKPKRLKGKWIHIQSAQGYSPRKILNGIFEIVSVHPFGITLRDSESENGLSSVLWIHTSPDWSIFDKCPR